MCLFLDCGGEITMKKRTAQAEEKVVPKIIKNTDCFLHCFHCLSFITCTFWSFHTGINYIAGTVGKYWYFLIDPYSKTEKLVAMRSLCHTLDLHVHNYILSLTCSTMVSVWPAIWKIYLDSELIWIALPFPMLSPSLLMPNRTIPTLCIAAPSRPCLLRFQGRGPTCPSCWAADWLAAALHEGWVKWQTGPHNPAQPESRLFQELFFQSLQPSFKSWTTYHTISTPAVRKQQHSTALA